MNNQKAIIPIVTGAIVVVLIFIGLFSKSWVTGDVGGVDVEYGLREAKISVSGMSSTRDLSNLADEKEASKDIKDMNTAGFTAYIILWSALVLCISAIVFTIIYMVGKMNGKVAMALEYISGGLLFFAIICYLLLTPTFKNNLEEFGYGWSFYLVIIGGIIQFIGGTLIPTHKRKKYYETFDEDEEEKDVEEYSEYECPDCGAALRAEDIICTDCGAEFEEEVDREMKNEKGEQSKRRRSNRRISSYRRKHSYREKELNWIEYEDECDDESSEDSEDGFCPLCYSEISGPPFEKCWSCGWEEGEPFSKETSFHHRYHYEDSDYPDINNDDGYLSYNDWDDNEDGFCPICYATLKGPLFDKCRSCGWEDGSPYMVRENVLHVQEYGHSNSIEIQYYDQSPLEKLQKEEKIDWIEENNEEKIHKRGRSRYRGSRRKVKDIGKDWGTWEPELEASPEIIIKMYYDDKMKPREIADSLEGLTVREVRDVIYKNVNFREQ